jgi:hypothetical protein
VQHRVALPQQRAKAVDDGAGAAVGLDDVVEDRA